MIISLVRFYSNLNFPNRFSKNTKISNFMEIRRAGAELFHADGQTDMAKPIVAFRNFANAPKILDRVTLMDIALVQHGQHIVEDNFHRWKISLKWKDVMKIELKMVVWGNVKWIWLRIGTGVALFWVRWNISRIVESLLGSKQGLWQWI
jgi:hypothetical protein